MARTSLLLDMRYSPLLLGSYADPLAIHHFPLFFMLTPRLAEKDRGSLVLANKFLERARSFGSKASREVRFQPTMS
jgi:hypothetical protein